MKTISEHICIPVPVMWPDEITISGCWETTLTAPQHAGRKSWDEDSNACENKAEM